MHVYTIDVIKNSILKIIYCAFSVTYFKKVISLNIYKTKSIHDSVKFNFKYVASIQTKNRPLLQHRTIFPFFIITILLPLIRNQTLH